MNSELLTAWIKFLRAPEAEPFHRYTGTGEGITAIRISKFLALNGHEVSVIRSHHMGWDAIEDNNLILVGPPKFNPQLAVMELSRNFRVDPDGIRNLDPNPGEPVLLPLQDDDEAPAPALVGRYPSPGGDGLVTVIASPNTFGTLAAGEYLTRPDYANNLVGSLTEAYGQVPLYFEAVLEARIDGEYPVDIRLVAHRTISRSNPEAADER